MKKLFFYSVFIVSLSVISCTKSSDQKANTLGAKDTLRIEISAEPPTLDWNQMTDLTSRKIVTNLMEGLLDYDMTDQKMKLVPALAEKWSSDPQGRQWTFILKKGVQWSDGVELEAQHFYDSWVRIMEPANGSKNMAVIRLIKNATAYNLGKLKNPKKLGIKVVNKHKIVVNLEKPFSLFPYIMAHVATAPIRKDIIDKHGPQWTEAKNIVTLGPYMLKQWNHDESLLLERNPKYFGKKPEVKKILARIVEKAGVALNLYRANELDILANISPSDSRQLVNHKDFHSAYTFIMYYYGFNVRKPPFDDINFRKAFAYAIDKNEIVKVLGGGSKAINSWLPAGVPGHSEKIGLSFNPQKAKEYLAKSKYKDIAKIPKIILGFNTNESHQLMSENFQAQIKRNLGIKIELRSEEWKTYLRNLKHDPPHIFRAGWGGEYPDPHTFMTIFEGSLPYNYAGWKNAEYDKLLAKASETMVFTQRLPIYEKLQRILTEDEVPALAIYSAAKNVLLSPRVQSYPFNPMGLEAYKYITFDKKEK